MDWRQVPCPTRESAAWSLTDPNDHPRIRGSPCYPLAVDPRRQNTTVSDHRNHVVRAKRCAACGEPFACYAGGCWCDTVLLPAEKRAQLLEQYAGCLCPTCLRQQARADTLGIDV